MTTANTQTGNSFTNLVDEVQSAPANQRPTKLIDGICDQMQASKTPETQQMGQHLRQIKPQLVQQLQQGG